MVSRILPRNCELFKIGWSNTHSQRNSIKEKEKMKNKLKRNLMIDHETSTIIMGGDFARRAANTESEEYKHLMSVKSIYSSRRASSILPLLYASKYLRNVRIYSLSAHSLRPHPAIRISFNTTPFGVSSATSQLFVVELPLLSLFARISREEP